jgi:hypothetical protein
MSRSPTIPPAEALDGKSPFFAKNPACACICGIFFVQAKLQPKAPMPVRKNPQQELFLDDVLPVPPENDYSATREYILERCKYDPEFKKYYKIHKTKICDQLTFMFGWAVDYNSLYHSLKRKLKYPRKPHLK